MGFGIGIGLGLLNAARRILVAITINGVTVVRSNDTTDALILGDDAQTATCEARVKTGGTWDWYVNNVRVAEVGASYLGIGSATLPTSGHIRLPTSPSITYIGSASATRVALTADGSNNVSVGDLNGNVFAKVGSGGQFSVLDADSADGVRIKPGSTGAASIQWNADSTSITYSQEDLTTNSGTGAATHIGGQNETGTTSVGGLLNLHGGSGTSTQGVVTVRTGGKTGTVRFTADGTGIGFYAHAPVALQTGVTVDAAGIHAALVNLGPITA